MKTYLIYATTGDNWELCEESTIVVAESEEEARSMYGELIKNSMGTSFGLSITGIEELDLSEKKMMIIQHAIVE